MFKIYQQYGDVVACIGNVLDSDNLHVFQQSNVAVGMSLEPLYRCFRCNGRINSHTFTHHNKSESGNEIERSLFQKYKPSKLEQLSANLNQLSCTSVFGSGMRINQLITIFRDARCYRISIEQTMCMMLVLYGVMSFTLLINLALGLGDFITQLQALYLIIVSVPLSAFSCLARDPENKSFMQVHKNSPKYMKTLDSTVFMIKANFTIGIVASVLLVMLKILQVLILESRFELNWRQLSYYFYF